MKLKRLEAISEYARAYDICTYEELCRQFDVSLTTMRRDVEELVRTGRVEKVYGGIKVLPKEEEEEEPLFRYEYAKDQIGKKAALFVEDHDIIVLGSGTTAAHMVKYLREKKGLTVITNNLAVMEEAVKYGFTLISIGGDLDRRTMSFVGTQSIKQLSELNADKAFLSCNGITVHGVSNVADLEADIKKKTMEISSKIYLLADHSKFGVKSLYSFARIRDLDGIFTDKRAPKEIEKYCREEGVSLYTAE